MATAVVLGASRGIGAALAQALRASGRYACVYAAARTEPPAESGCVTAAVDCTDAVSLAAFADAVTEPVDVLLHCVGTLNTGPRTPEKSLSDIDPERFLAAFKINTLSAVLALRAFAPHLRRADQAVAGVLSARVGSIGDNHLGGWYGYRASKAALNQVVRTAAIELGRGARAPIVVAIHPGTTRTDLSAPFVARREGVVEPDVAAARILAVVGGLTAADSGQFFNWDGQPLPW